MRSRVPGRAGAGPVSKAGFSLVEVAVALVVLALGLLGVAGMVAQAASTLARAAALQRSTRALEEVADSLVAASDVAAGDRLVGGSGGVTVEWRLEGTRLELRADPGHGADSIVAAVIVDRPSPSASSP